MKRILISALFLGLVFLPAWSQADVSKMDLSLQAMVSQPTQGKLYLSKALKPLGDETLVDCFIKSNDVVATERAIWDMGGIVRTVLKTIITADVPLNSLQALSDREEVVAIESSKPLNTKMNEARIFTNVVPVQDGTGLPEAFNGDRVLVGVVDDQLNWSNSDFTSGAGTRVQYLQQTVGGNKEICYKNDIDNNNCSVTDNLFTNAVGHGTHVTGIAAGADSVYKGVAPEAWIAFVFNAAQDADSAGTFATAVVDAVNDIFNFADDESMASVVNLSLGTSLGAHDDTSLLEQGLDQLVTNSTTGDKPGRVIVNAAGNENVNPNPFGASASVIGGIHADIDVPASESRAVRFGVWRNASNPGQIGQYVLSYVGAILVDIWLDVGQNANCVLDAKAYPYDPSTESILPPTGTPDDTGDASVYFAGNVPFALNTTDSAADAKIQIAAVTTDAETGTNNKPHGMLGITLVPGGTYTDIEEYAFDVIIRETSGTGSCTGNIWLYPDQTLFHDFLTTIAGREIQNGAHGNGYKFNDGDSFKTTTIPGTASGVITVGSYMDRGTWVDINGATQHQDVYDPAIDASGGTAGQMSLFSSLGPTATGLTKPDVVAPGEPILSTLFTGYNPSAALKGDSDHWKLQGTSMAAPHVTGVIALLLGKNNCLTTQTVRTVLTETANDSTLTTTYTTDPKNTYGFGIVDALAAIQHSLVPADLSCYSGDGGSGGGGGGGCGGSLIPGSVSAAPAAMALLLSPLAAIWWRRRKKNRD